MKFEDWKSFKLGEILETLIDYRGKTPTKTLSGIPLITAKIVKNGFIQEPTEFIAKEDYDGWMTRGFPKIGDVVLTVEAPLGEVAQIKSTNIALAQRIITLRGKKNVLDNGFLKYFLQSNIGQQRLQERGTGTTVIGIKQSELRLIEINLPNIETQTRIAAILTSLDDKIELNRQMNTTLEGIAQTLFQEMCLPKAGERMEGWREGRFEDVSVQVKANLNPSQSPQKLFNHYSLPAFDNGEVPALDLGETIMSNKTMVKKYSVLFSKLNPRIPRIWSIGNIEPSISICSTEFVGFVPKDASYYSFINYFLKQSEIINKLISHATGTSSSHQRVKPADILILPIMIPPDELLQRFDRIVKPLLEKKFSNLEETQTLTTLRDSLLPKLMRGELLI